MHSASSLVKPEDVKTVASVGLGTVGAGWAALMLARGITIRGFDSGHNSEKRARSLIESAWPSLLEIGLTAEKSPPFEQLQMFNTIESTVQGCDVVQENTPEDLAEKQAVLRKIDAATAPSAVILSSTGGFTPSALQKFLNFPERLVVFHPFNPTHLIPLVEVVPSDQTDEAVVEWAMSFAEHLKKRPIRLRSEIVGHMTNRLQFALLREAVRCMLENVASPKDIDAAVRYGLAPRWMLMGGLQTLHLAGGHGGMQAILDHAGPAIEEWWHPDGEIRLSEDVKCAMVSAGRELSADSEIAEWMEWRDTELVPLLRAQEAAEAKQPSKRSELGPDK